MFYNLVIRVWTKHLELDYHFVREIFMRGDLYIQHISSNEQVADMFTKPLPLDSFF